MFFAYKYVCIVCLCQFVPNILQAFAKSARIAQKGYTMTNSDIAKEGVLREQKETGRYRAANRTHLFRLNIRSSSVCPLPEKGNNGQKIFWRNENEEKTF